MNEQNTQGASQKKIGTGEGEVPLTQVNPQNVMFRTQASDVSSMQQSGGGRPEPYSMDSQLKQAAVAPSANQSSAGPTFNPPQVPTQAPPASSAPQRPVAQPATPAMPISSGGSHSSKRIFFAVLTLIVIAGLAFVGYAVIYPVFFEKGNNIEVPAASTKESGAAEEAGNQPQTEPEQKNADSGAGEPASSKGIYESIFTNAPQTVRTAQLSELSREKLVSAFGVESLPAPDFRENVFTLNGASPSAAVLLDAAFPQVFSAETLKMLEGYSFFSYVDGAGTWPGAVLRLASGVSAADAVSRVQSELERAPSQVISAFYTKTAGEAQGGWKQGQTQDVKNRYVVFGAGNAAVSFNYGWFGETLVLSTSYDGFKEALRYLR